MSDDRIVREAANAAIAALGLMALDALGDVYRDMLAAAKGGDEWAEGWLSDMWDEFPVQLRQALGDTYATTD